MDMISAVLLLALGIFLFAICFKTVEFFESVGIKTKLSDYGVGCEIIPKIVDRFVKRGIKAIGERGDLTMDDVTKILEIQLK